MASMLRWRPAPETNSEGQAAVNPAGPSPDLATPSGVLRRTWGICRGLQGLHPPLNEKHCPV
jgi:hypothetical protein